MLLDDIADLLTTGGVFTSTTLSKGFLPDTPDVMAALYETGGFGPTHTMGSPSVAVAEQPRVQLVCRGAAYDYATPRATMHSAFKFLDGMARRTINSVEYKWIAAVQSPFLMGRDEAGRVEIACNFDVTKDLSP